MPDYIHNDRATDFLSDETYNYLHSKGIATSRTSRYNPRGNGQVEKLNGTLWKGVQVTLHSRNMKDSEWESVLPDVLHSIRSLLCTSTNTTPHERMFNFTRKSTAGKSIPSWVKPGPIYVKNHRRTSKNDPPVMPATLLHANPQYAYVQLPSGIETTVSLREISPAIDTTTSDTSFDNYYDNSIPIDNVEKCITSDTGVDTFRDETNVDVKESSRHDNDDNTPNFNPLEPTNTSTNEETITQARRSTRNRRTPLKYKDFDTG